MNSKLAVLVIIAMIGFFAVAVQSGCVWTGCRDRRTKPETWCEDFRKDYKFLKLELCWNGAGARALCCKEVKNIDDNEPCVAKKN